MVKVEKEEGMLLMSSLLMWVVVESWMRMRRRMERREGRRMERRRKRRRKSWRFEVGVEVEVGAAVRWWL